MTNQETLPYANIEGFRRKAGDSSLSPFAAKEVQHDEPENEGVVEEQFSAEKELESVERQEVARTGELSLDETKLIVSLIERVKDDPDAFQESIIEIYKVIDTLPADHEVKQKANAAILNFMKNRSNLKLAPEMSAAFLEVLAKISAETGDKVWQDIIDHQSARATAKAFEGWDFGSSDSEDSAPVEKQPEIDFEMTHSEPVREEPEQEVAVEAMPEVEAEVESAPEAELEVAEPEQVDEHPEEEPKAEEVEEPEEVEEVDPEMERLQQEFEQGQDEIESAHADNLVLLEQIDPALVEASKEVLGFDSKDGYERKKQEMTQVSESQNEQLQQAA